MEDYFDDHAKDLIPRYRGFKNASLHLFVEWIRPLVLTLALVCLDRQEAQVFAVMVWESTRAILIFV